MSLLDLLIYICIVIPTIFILDGFLAKELMLIYKDTKIFRLTGYKLDSFAIGLISMLVFWFLVMVIFKNDIFKFRFLVVFLGALICGTILQISEILKNK